MKQRIRTAGVMTLAAVPLAIGQTAPAAGAQAPSEGGLEAGPAEGERHCVTEALTPGALDAGVVSEIVCDSTPAEALRTAASAWGRGGPGRASASGSIVLAVHHSDSSGNGSSLTVTGAACDGGGINLAAGDYWNDRIRSTRHRSCSDVKHWVDANNGGAAQITTAGDNTVVALNSTLAGNVSSIRYYGG